MFQRIIRILIVAACMCLPCLGFASGQGTHIYKGKYTNYSDIVYTWDGEHLYRGKYANYSDVVLTYDCKHVYKSRYKNYSDIILTCGAPIPVPILLWVLM